jgi:hypothetical protein
MPCLSNRFVTCNSFLGRAVNGSEGGRAGADEQLIGVKRRRFTSFLDDRVAHATTMRSPPALPEEGFTRRLQLTIFYIVLTS